MAISTRLDPIGRDIRLVLDDVASPQARSAILADTARDEISKAAAKNRAALGRAAPVETYVDGRRGARLEDVSPDGTIIAEFDLVMDVLDWIRGQLEEHSPVGRGEDKRPGHPGLYRASHELIVDGRLVPTGAPVPVGFDRAVFVSTVPYARKIERGQGQTKPLSDGFKGVYQTVATLASRRFGNIAQIKYSFEAPLFGDIETWAQTTSMTSGSRRGAQRQEWLRRQPAIVVTLR